MLDPSNSLAVIPPLLSLSRPLSACLSIAPPAVSLSLSAVAVTCLGFDVFVFIVTEAMAPPTSDL